MILRKTKKKQNIACFRHRIPEEIFYRISKINLSHRIHISLASMVLRSKILFFNIKKSNTG